MMAVDGEERMIVGIEQEFGILWRRRGDGTGIRWLAVDLEDNVTGSIGEG